MLLKAEFGIGVESWGGHGDYGRDAYAGGYLRFPARDIESEGPFVFQAKFVEGANVPGAEFQPKLLAAARAELARIEKRIIEKQWQRPKHYALFTNSPLSVEARNRVREVFKDIPG